MQRCHFLGFLDQNLSGSIFLLIDQRNLGMSMRVKKSTLEDVKARFAAKRQETEEKKKNYDIEERMRELQEEVRGL